MTKDVFQDVQVSRYESDREWLRQLEEGEQKDQLQVWESMPAGQARAVVNHFRKVFMDNNDPALNKAFKEKAIQILRDNWPE